MYGTRRAIIIIDIIYYNCYNRHRRRRRHGRYRISIEMYRWSINERPVVASGLRAAEAALYKWTYKYSIINTKIVTLAFSLSHSRIYELPGRVLDTKTLIPLCAYDVYAYTLYSYIPHEPP